jgi:hypothetical protein
MGDEKRMILVHLIGPTSGASAEAARLLVPLGDEYTSVARQDDIRR